MHSGLYTRLIDDAAVAALRAHLLGEDARLAAAARHLLLEVGGAVEDGAGVALAYRGLV